MQFTPLILATIIAATLSPCLSSAEIVTATDKVVAKFMALDTDETLTVSFEEYEQMVLLRMGERFTAMDTNEDNEISEEEYRNFWTTQQAKYYRPIR